MVQEYPTDLALNEDMDIYLDGANDLATISGVDQLEQSVALDVRDVTLQFVGEPITGPAIGLLEERVQRALARDEQLSQVKNVVVQEYDRREDTIRIDILVIDDEDFTIEVSA
jgi:hypothetical protein